MAVRIDIPGIGTVNAENAATESTLQELAKVLARSTGERIRFQSDVQNSFTRLGDYARNSANRLSDVGLTANQAINRIVADNKELSDVQLGLVDRIRYGSRIYDLVATNLRNLADTVTEATVAYARNYTQIAQNPIQEGSKILNKAIGVSSLIIQNFGEALKNTGQSIPFFGAGLAGGGALIKGAAQVFGTVLQGLNELLSEEFQKTVQTFQALSSQGAIFSNGMSGMRLAAISAGTTIDLFAAGVLRSRQALAGMGEGFTTGAQRIADTMFQFDQLSDSGVTLREQFLAMGYSYSDQVELTANYLAMLRSTTSAQQYQMTNLTDVATATRDYARDLKVLQAITGEDAEAAMRSARAKMMEADVYAQLAPEQRERFQKVFATLPEQMRLGLLEMISSGGSIVDVTTNIVRANSEQFASVQDEAYRIIMNSMLSGSDAQKEILRIGGDMAEEARRTADPNGPIAAIARAGRLGGDALGNAVSGMFTDFISRMYTGEVVDAQYEASEKQLRIIDETTRAAIKLQTEANRFAVDMEKEVLKVLPKYGELLQAVNAIMFKMVTGLLDLTGELSTIGYNERDELTINGQPMLEYMKQKFGFEDVNTTEGQQNLDKIKKEGGPGTGLIIAQAQITDKAVMDYMNGGMSSSELYALVENAKDNQLTQNVKTGEAIAKLDTTLQELKEAQIKYIEVAKQGQEDQAKRDQRIVEKLEENNIDQRSLVRFANNGYIGTLG